MDLGLGPEVNFISIPKNTICNCLSNITKCPFHIYIYIYIYIYISADPHLKGPSCEALRLTPSPHFQPSIPSLSYDWELLLDPIIYDHTYQLVADKEVSRKWRGASAIFYLSSRAFYDFSIIVDLLSLIFCLLCAICYLLSYDL